MLLSQMFLSGHVLRSQTAKGLLLSRCLYFMFIVVFSFLPACKSVQSGRMPVLSGENFINN